MLTTGRRALHLKTPSQPPIWICKRCFHAQSRRNIQQQLDQPPDPSKTPDDKPLSPIEAFLKQYAKKSKQSPTQQRNNVVVDSAPSLGPGAPSFSEIAEAYRKNVASKQRSDSPGQKPKTEKFKEKDDVGGSDKLYKELNR